MYNPEGLKMLLNNNQSILTIFVCMHARGGTIRVGCGTIRTTIHTHGTILSRYIRMSFYAAKTTAQVVHFRLPGGIDKAFIFFEKQTGRVSPTTYH